MCPSSWLTESNLWSDRLNDWQISLQVEMTALSILMWVEPQPPGWRIIVWLLLAILTQLCSIFGYIPRTMPNGVLEKYFQIKETSTFFFLLLLLKQNLAVKWTRDNRRPMWKEETYDSQLAIDSVFFFSLFILPSNVKETFLTNQLGTPYQQKSFCCFSVCFFSNKSDFNISKQETYPNGNLIKLPLSSHC